MHSKSNEKTDFSVFVLPSSLPKSFFAGIKESLGGHLFLVFIGIAAVWRPFQSTKKVEMVIVENPKVSNQVKPTEIQKIPPKPKTPPKRAVFGLSKRTLVSDRQDTKAPEIKAGNTVAKEQDNLKLNPDDDDSLPVPTDEVFITKMPRLKSEFRVPYPPEAKAAGIQGAVIMELLIDDKGKVRKATLLEGPGYGLNEAALEAVKKFEFEPAEMKDQTVATVIRYAYRFTLEK